MAIPGPPLKRTKSGLLTEGTRTKTNLSQSRREKEILRVISDNDGIVSISSKEFLEAHAALLDSLIKCGEQVSTIAGSRIDKRTVDSTLKALESRGKVKFLSTIIATSTGASRTVKIAYLPEISPETLSAFLSDLSRQPQMPQPPVPVKTLTTPVEYGGIKVKAPALPTVVSLADRDVDEKGNAQKAEELFRQDEDTIRDSLLTERSTVAQLYGYIPGKAARARELHLAALHAFTASHRAPSIVSTEQRIIHLSYFYTHLSSSAYCSFVSCLTHNEELLKLLDSTAGRSTPVGNLPRHLYNLLQPSRSRSQARILDLLDFLQALHLVVPLESSTDPHAEYQCDSNDNHPTTFSTFTSQEYTTLNAPQYWHFTPNAPIHLWARSETEPPFWKSVSISSKDIANLEYWKDLEHVCLDYSYTTELTVLPPDGTNPANVPLSIIKTLRRPSSWKDSYSLSWYQKEYLKLAIDNPTGNTPLQDTLSGQTRLTSLAKVISAPREIVKSFYASMHEKRVREIERMKRRARKKTEEEKAKEHAEEKAVLAKRAGEARLQREREFDEMVKKICSEPPKGSTEIRIRRIRTRFMQSGGTDPRKWETEVGQAIEEAKMTAKKVMASSRPSTMMVMTTPGLGSGMLLGTTMTMPPPMVASSSVPEKSIEDLIAQQGPPLTPKTPKKKTTKGKEKEQVEEGKSPPNDSDDR